jgi:hypothetical protein
LANGPRDRQTDTLNYEISTVWETKTRTTLQKAQKDFLCGEGTGIGDGTPKPCKLDDDEFRREKFDFENVTEVSRSWYLCFG